MQCLFSGYRSQQWMVHKIAADKCRNATDPDFFVLYKAKRKQDKTARRDIARHIIPGSGRRYHKAVSEMKSSVITIQCYARVYMARRKVSSMRRGIYIYRRRSTTYPCQDTVKTQENDSNTTCQRNVKINHIHI